jgi:hypothetical protein
LARRLYGPPGKRKIPKTKFGKARPLAAKTDALERLSMVKKELLTTYKHPGHANQSVHGRRGGGGSARAKRSAAKKSPSKPLISEELKRELVSRLAHAALTAAIQHGPGLVSSGARAVGRSELAAVVRGGGTEGGVRYRINRGATIRSWVGKEARYKAALQKASFKIQAENIFRHLAQSTTVPQVATAALGTLLLSQKVLSLQEAEQSAEVPNAQPAPETNAPTKPDDDKGHVKVQVEVSPKKEKSWYRRQHGGRRKRR